MNIVCHHCHKNSTNLTSVICMPDVRNIRSRAGTLLSKTDVIYVNQNYNYNFGQIAMNVVDFQDDQTSVSVAEPVNIENVPMLDFSKLYEAVQSNKVDQEIKNIKPEHLINSDDGSDFNKLFPSILDVFDNSDIINLLGEELKQPPEILIKFKKFIHKMLPASEIKPILNLWPPVLPTSRSESKTLVYFLIKIILKLKNPRNFIKWLEMNIVDLHWHGRSSRDNSVLKGVCVCNKKTKVLKDNHTYWAELCTDGLFTMYRIKNEQLEVCASGNCGSVRINKKGTVIKLLKNDGSRLKGFIPKDKNQIDFWKKIKSNNPPSFPLMLTSLERPFPDSIIPALYEAIIADDLLVVRTLLHHKVTKILDGTCLAEALLDIFSHAGKVNELLLLLVGIEFENPHLENNMILRNNSQLTNMFKVFYKRYGKSYFDKSFLNVVKYIDKAGDLKLQNPINASESRCKSVMFSVLRFILKSSSAIPPEMRHLASILKAFSTKRFNNKKATYNTLSSFFCLRFINAALADPKTYSPQLQLENESGNVLVPFSALLMCVFNLLPLSGRFEVFNSWNNRLSRHTFPRLINFVMSIADYDEMPKYIPPSSRRFRQSLEYIMWEITNSQAAFRDEYINLANMNKGSTVLGWNFGVFLQSFFHENINPQSNSSL